MFLLVSCLVASLTYPGDCVPSPIPSISRVKDFLTQMPVPGHGILIKRLIFLKLNQVACQGVLISQEPGSHGSLGIFP